MMRNTLIMCALLLASVAAAQAPPVDGRGWYELGIQRHDARDYKGALQAYEKALELKFFSPMLGLRRVRAHTLAGEKEQAFTLLQQMAANGYGNVNQLLGDNDLLTLRSDPRWKGIVETAQKNQHPCAGVPEYRQLDYWLGDWDVEISGAKVARSTVHLVLDDCAVQENYWVIDGSYSGKSFSMWDAQQKRWEQHYVDTNGASRELLGGLEGDRIVLFVRGQGPTPNTVRRMSYVRDGPDRVRQIIEVSTDAEKTWVVGFEGIYTRRK